MRAFISYSSQESGFAENLAALLRERGDQVFLASDISAGQDWQSEVASAIRSADVMIALIGDENHTLYELGFATGASVPVLVVGDPGKRLPDALAAAPFVGLTRNTGRDLRAALHRIDGLRSFLDVKLSRRFETAEAELRAASRDPGMLESLSPMAFERLVANLLRERGFSVELPGAGADSGVDIVLNEGSEAGKVLVQVKKLATHNRVSVDAVNRFASAVAAADARGMLVASSSFTAAALDLALDTPVALRTLDQVLSAGTAEELLGTDQRGELASLSGLASAYIKRGDTATALKYYERTLELSQAIGDKNSEAFALCRIAASHAARGSEETLDYYARARSLCEEIGDISGTADALVGAAAFHARSRNAGAAREYYVRASELYEQAGNRTGQAEAFAGLATALITSGEVDDAIEFYSRSSVLMEQIGDLQGLGYVLGRTASAHARKGDAENALDLYKKAMLIQERIGDMYGLAASLGGMAAVLGRQARHDEALEFYEQSRAANEQVGNQRGVAASLAGMGRVLLKKGEAERALERFQAAVMIQRKLGDKFHLSKTLHGLKEAAGLAGDKKLAKRCSKELSRLKGGDVHREGQPNQGQSPR